MPVRKQQPSKVYFKNISYVKPSKINPQINLAVDVIVGKMAENPYMSFNLNEKCLLNYLCKFQNYPSEQIEVKNNLVNLLEDFGIVVHSKHSGYSNQIYEIIESYEKV